MPSELAASSALARLRTACVGACALLGGFAAPASATPSLSWSAPAQVDPGQALRGISCPSAGLCVIVDGSGNALVSTDPIAGAAAAWSRPFAIDAGNALTSVSCASSTLCVAVDGEGNALLSTDPAAAGAAAWSKPFAIDAGKALSSVSCAASLCVAVDGGGDALLSSDPAAGEARAWSAPFAIKGAKALASVSCASSTLCAAVDNEGDVALSGEPAAAGAWRVRLIDPGFALASISCSSGGSCAAIDAAGDALASPDAAAQLDAGAGPGSGATWSSTPFDVFGAPRAVSCAAGGLCVAVDGAGYAFASDDATAAAPAWLASGIDAGALSGVACAAEGLCVAVDASGRVFSAEVPAPVVVAGAASESPHASGSPTGTPGRPLEGHPSIRGTPAPGQRLTCKPGVSASGATLSYAWLRDTRAIAGATGSTYVVGRADVSHHLQCRVTASAAEGGKSATSAFVTVPAGGIGTIFETTVGAPRAGRSAVSVPLRCSPQAVAGCTIELRLSVIETLRAGKLVAVAAQGTRRTSVTLAASTVRLRRGQHARVTLALNAAGRRLLALVRRMTVRLSVSGTVVGVISAALKRATVTLAVGARVSSREPAELTGGGADGPARAGHPSTTYPADVLAPTPYMGWDTYFTFGSHYDEATVLAQASQLLTRGLARAAYRYVWLDVGWWQGARNAAGQITVSAAQWPHGMAWLARTLHGAGLKVGIYTDAGSEGCGGPGQGSYGHYQQDVNAFAAWGFDAVKVDFCGGVRQGLRPAAAYAAVHQAIVGNSSHRAMLLSICDYLQPGEFAPEEPTFEDSAFTSYTFGPSSGNSWRTDTDVGAPGDVQFVEVLRNLDADAAEPQAAGPGHWNDPDYLAPDQGMSDLQFRAQFSMWAMLAAPLMISADLLSLSNVSQRTVSNPEAIAIDQDPAGLQARLLASRGEGQVWVKPLSDGSRAIALLNRGSGTVRLSTTPGAVGLPRARGYALRNVWSGALTLLGASGRIAASVPGGATVLLRVSAQ